jgi:hypothetical protein
MASREGAWNGTETSEVHRRIGSQKTPAQQGASRARRVRHVGGGRGNRLVGVGIIIVSTVLYVSMLFIESDE